jgi:hypothetical protein
MNGSFTARYAHDSKRAAHHIECIRHIQKYTDSFPIEDVWKLFDDISIDEREKLIKKTAKTEKKRAAAFSTDIPKPKNVLNRYRELFREECRENKTDYTDAAFKAAYKEISAELRAQLEEECEAEKEEYKRKYADAMKSAIETGDYTEPKPKAPQSAYFIFSNAVQDALKTRKPKAEIASIVTKAVLAEFDTLKADAEQAKAGWTKESGEKKPSVVGSVAKKIAELYKTLTEAQNKVWSDKAEANKLKYHQDLYDWKVRVLQRQIGKCEREGTDPSAYQKELTEVMTVGVTKPKPAVAKPAAVATASSGKTPVAKKAAVKVTVSKPTAPAEPVAEEDEPTTEAEAAPAEEVASAPKTRGRKPAAKTAPEPIAEEEGDEDAPAEPVAAPAAKRGRKPKTDA